MPESGLPLDVQKFIAKYIESVEKLEILLLLGNTPEKQWSAEQVDQEIKSNQSSINQKLQNLCSDGFLEYQDGHYRFQPKSVELAQAVTALAACYQTRRIKVIEAIFSKGTDELRNFANAFRLRKENE
jgi:predicted transcriptional regulator